MANENKGIIFRFSTKVDKVQDHSLLADSEIERLGTLHNYDDTAVRGLITDEATARSNADGVLNTAIESEASARSDADTALQGRASALETAVGTLNGADTVAGSVAKTVKDAVAAEAELRAAGDDAVAADLDDLDDFVRGESSSVDYIISGSGNTVLNGSYTADPTEAHKFVSTTGAILKGTESDGVVTVWALFEDAEGYSMGNPTLQLLNADPTASGWTDVYGAIEPYPTVVAGVPFVSLDDRVTANEAALAALGSVSGGSIADALATKVDSSTYTAKVAELEGADSALDGRMTAAEGSITTITGSGEGSISKAVSDAKSTIDAYTVNGYAVSTSPVLNGQDVAITGYTADANSSLSGISASSTVTAAIDKIDEVLAVVNGSDATAGSIAKALKDAKDYADSKVGNLGSVFNYKGTKADLATLEAVVTGNEVGDVWLVTNASAPAADQNLEYVCVAVDSSTGAGTWERLGTNVDLSGYYTKTEVQGFTVNGKYVYNNPTLAGNDINLGSGYSAISGSVLTGIATGSSIDAAFDKVDEVLKTQDTAIATLNGDASTAGSVAKAVADEAAIARAAEQANAAAITTLNGDANTSGSVAYAVAAEATRATGVESGLQSAIDTINGNASTAGSIAYAVAAEETRATGVESGLATRLTTVEGVAAANTSAIATLNGDNTTTGSVAKAVKDAVDAEAATARAAEQANANAITALQARASALEGASSYEFINVTTSKQLENKFYIVRNAALTATLPSGDAAVGAQIRIIINEAAAALNGSITPATGDTINGGASLALDVSMDMTLLYDSANHDWVVLAFMG